MGAPTDGTPKGPVSVLFARRTSVYRRLGAEVFDVDRDARSFDLRGPVVAHPPCRGWGRLSHFAKPRPDERDLAVWAMWVVRHCGGVLEHPADSRLWRFFGLRPGVRDEFGGVLVPVDQCAFGHRARKRSGIYCVGCLVEVPLLTPYAATTVEVMGAQERERTPLPFARVLLETAAAAIPGGGDWCNPPSGFLNLHRGVFQ